MAGEIKTLGETTELAIDKLERVPTIDGEAFSIETEKIKVFDPGAGEATVLRHFFFKKNVLPRGVPKFSKLDILNQNKRLIELSLWSDGLTIRLDKPMEIHTRHSCRKRYPSLHQKMITECADYAILVLAAPRHNQTVLERPHRAI